jgi:hypothetical protein
MKIYALYTILLALCLFAPKCQKSGTGPLTPQQSTVARHTIMDYLECEECQEDQLKAVVKLGLAAVPSLAASLREGPPNLSLELLRRNVALTYRELKAYEQTHPEAKITQSEEFYVKLYTDNYVALYQSRAAMALAAIGGLEAKQALQEAMSKPLRGDVLTVVKTSLEKVN